MLPEYQAFSEHEIFMIACCLNIKPLGSSEHEIFMIACCLNIKPVASSEHETSTTVYCSIGEDRGGL